LIDKILTGTQVTLRPVGSGDKEKLRQIFSDPEVARWWGDPGKSVEDALAVSEDDSQFLIELGGETIGFIQCSEETDPMYQHASIDISLRSPWQGKGLGPDAIRTLARYLIKEHGHHRLTIDPAAHNTRAIKAYERIGFKPIGLMRQYELGPSGEWHDGLLMDLLADGLRD
jgi:aminoglycoside 6'-N-acetyltransferase